VLGRTFDLDIQVGANATTAGYADAFTGSVTTGWLVLAAITSLSLVGTVATLRRRS